MQRAGVFECLHRGQLLRKQPGLHLPGNFHFLRGAAIGLHALRHFFREAYVFQSDARLGRYRVEQTLVFPGIRLLGKSRPKHEHANEVVLTAEDRHQAFRREGASAVTLRPVGAGGRLPTLSRGAQGRRNTGALAESVSSVAGQRSGDRGQPAIAGFQVTRERFRVQSLAHVTFEQHSPVRDGRPPSAFSPPGRAR